MTLNESLNENRMNSFEKFEQRLKTFKVWLFFVNASAEALGWNERIEINSSLIE